MNVSELVKRITFGKAYDYLDRDPERNFLKLVNWLETLDKNGFVAKRLPLIRKYAEDADSNWYRLACSFWEDVDAEVRKTLFTNFVLNGNLLENEKLTENRKQYNCNIPWAIELDPTSRCDLRCAAGEGDDELSFDKMDELIEQGKTLGTFFYFFAGGEPLLRGEDLIALCNKHEDCVFFCITNGALLDDDFAQQLLRVRNMIPILMLDGFARETDARRGDGTFEKLRCAAELLRGEKLPFGLYVCCTAQNWETVSGEAFFDEMVAWGAKAALFAPYLPGREDARAEYILTAEQRVKLCAALTRLRETKPLLILDFCLSGILTEGCIAAGRGYCRVSAAGNVEPCAFLPCSDTNVRTATLLDAYRSPLFQAFRARQPFGADPMRPCPLLDHTDLLGELLVASCPAGSAIPHRDGRGNPAEKPGTKKIEKT